MQPTSTNGEMNALSPLRQPKPLPSSSEPVTSTVLFLALRNMWLWGSEMGSEFTYQPKWDPIGFDPQPYVSRTSPPVLIWVQVLRSENQKGGGLGDSNMFERVLVIYRCWNKEKELTTVVNHSFRRIHAGALRLGFFMGVLTAQVGFPRA